MQMDIRSRFSPLVWDGDRIIWSPPQLSGHDGFHFHRICGKNEMVNLPNPHQIQSHGPTQTHLSDFRVRVCGP